MTKELTTMLQISIRIKDEEHCHQSCDYYDYESATCGLFKNAPIYSGENFSLIRLQDCKNSFKNEG